MANEDGQDYIYSTDKTLGFKGVSTEYGIKAECNHENANVLRRLFPYTAPSRVLQHDKSFGVGDRLGVAAVGHIKVFERYDAYPVLVQQSIRELNLTHRTYEDVLDCVTYTVFKTGYKKGFGADGDHLKTEQDIQYALGLGFTMITLDCSEHIITDIDADFAVPQATLQRYADKFFEIEDGEVLSFDKEQLKQISMIYDDAIAFAADIYHKYIKGSNADFEISIDETATTTTPLQHFYVANELKQKGVNFATMAPRFCGEFQKGIDYIGDIAQFEKEIDIHAKIARYFGYKISVHSGSDKFSIFPMVAKATKGVFHVKTAGTNWLEAMRVVAAKDAELYRQIHKYALKMFTEAKKYYHVTTDITKIPDIDSLKDEDLPKLFDQNESRQLIHITYGFILDEYRGQLYTLWGTHHVEYEKALLTHIGKHLDLLGVPLISLK
ncbi:MAG: hypothetical protein GX800_10985 [Clostridiaceae bacterium]|nr:hypothetical protein [Clostridiaceae bacterium]